jgi:UDP-N-acetylglucosamine--N-acetylmuramyl-(pentapeptide) pyrophosphoryl-undecaprenol N-acetylglucosamine transferase
MVDEKAAVMIANADLNGERLATTIRALLSDSNRLLELEQNARRLAILDAEQRIVDLAERAAGREHV